MFTNPEMTGSKGQVTEQSNGVVHEQLAMPLSHKSLAKLVVSHVLVISHKGAHW